MTNLFNTEDFVQNLFDFRRDFDEIFNQMVSYKPWNQQPSTVGRTWNFVPAVESMLIRVLRNTSAASFFRGLSQRTCRFMHKGIC